MRGMIRQFRPEDASSCCRLVHTCLDEDSSLAPSLKQKVRANETPQSMIERSRLFYVAVYEKNDFIEGVAGLDLNEIRLLFVSPDCRRRGIGRMLLEHAKSLVPGSLFPDIFVYSSPQATAFYKACGFLERGPCDFLIEEERLHTVFMTLLTGQHPVSEHSPGFHVNEVGRRAVHGGKE